VPVNEVVVKGFFSSIFCGRGCKGPGHQRVATRGLRGTARGRGCTINVPSISLDRPSLRNTSHYCKPLCKHGQKVAMMSIFCGRGVMDMHNDVSSRGGCGILPGDEGVRSTCRVYPWIDRHCEIRHTLL
jgi:hypothetical protein